MKTAIAFGSFDGLHAGHRAVLDAVRDYRLVVFTFSSVPKYYGVGGNQLMTLQDRIDALKILGAGEVFVADYAEYKDMSPQDFLEFINRKFNPSAFSCGFDFRFGKGAFGTPETIMKYAEANGITLFCVPPVKAADGAISSRDIRELVENGEIEKANALLLKPFGFSTSVIEGEKRGRTLGFPTANQPIPCELVVPRLGVYKSRITVDGKTYKSVTDVGNKPTFCGKQNIAETFIFDFSKDIYGKTARLELLSFLRPEKKFNNADELLSAIKKDISEAEL